VWPLEHCFEQIASAKRFITSTSKLSTTFELIQTTKQLNKLAFLLLGVVIDYPQTF